MAPLVRTDCHYSGPRSKGFWRRVNSLPGTVGEAVFILAIGLQEMEERALQMLRRVEADTPKKRKGK